MVHKSWQGWERRYSLLQTWWEAHLDLEFETSLGSDERFPVSNEGARMAL